MCTLMLYVFISTLYMSVCIYAHLVRCCCLRSVRHVLRWRALACLPSVWKWRHRGLSRKLGSGVRQKGSIHPRSPSKPQTRSRAQEWMAKEREREREKPHEHTGNVRGTWVRLWSAVWISGLPVLALLCSRQALSSDKHAKSTAPYSYLLLS